VTLKSGLGVVKGHWKWRRIRLTIISLPLYLSLYLNCIVFELFDVE